MAEEAEDDVAWVRFTADHDWRPAVNLGTTAYKVGMRCRVMRACVAEVATVGHGEEIAAPDAATAERLLADPYAEDESPPAEAPAKDD